MSVLHLSEAGFDKAVNAGMPALVDFWAGWCGPCKMVGPIIEQLAEKYDGKAVVAKVDVDAEPGLAQRFGVMSIPTVVILKDGQEVERMVGAMPLDAYSAKLDQVL